VAASSTGFSSDGLRRPMLRVISGRYPVSCRLPDMVGPFKERVCWLRRPMGVVHVHSMLDRFVPI
jgi:hypothetical protein